MTSNKTLSQAGQDLFARKILKDKTKGYFLEIGSNHPITFNNTYLFEKEYGWTGLMVECDSSWSKLYIEHRTSPFVIQDATTIDYVSLFQKYLFPQSMDYLQIDLEVSNRSTLSVLELLDKTIFPDHKFAVVTFEHDIYRGDHFQTRAKSREIFQKNGYILAFGDVKHQGHSFEDWYVYPSLVDMVYVEKIKSSVSLEFTDILKILT